MHRQGRGEAEYEIQDRTVKVVNDRLAVFESRYDFMQASKQSAGKSSHPHPQIELPQATLWDEIIQAHHVQASKALLQTHIDAFVELEKTAIPAADKKALQNQDKKIKSQRDEVLKLRSDLNKEIAAAILATPADNSRDLKIKLKCFYDHIKADLGIDLHVNALTERGQSPVVLLQQIKEAVSHFPDKASKKAFTEALKALEKEIKLVEKQEATAERQAVSIPQNVDIPQPIHSSPLDDYPEIGDKLAKLGLNMTTAPELESFVVNVSKLDPNNELDREGIEQINEVLNQAYHVFSQTVMTPADKVDFIVDALFQQADLYEDDNYPVRSYLLQAANDIQYCVDEFYGKEEEPLYTASSTSTPATSHYASLAPIFSSSRPAEKNNSSMLKTMTREEVEDFLIDQIGISEDAVYDKLGQFLNLYQQDFQAYHKFVVDKDPAHDHFRHSSLHYKSVVVEMKGALLAVDMHMQKYPKERTDEKKIELLQKAFGKILDRVKSTAENAASDQGYRYHRAEWTCLHDLYKKLNEANPAPKYRR